ncbi:phosphohydrolase [Nitratidesulfovibrio liaohensis]|uniref:phosphohydrolase n=1 Tax=Nitratidesulfovibrio liaohensis TaxID=2604158 RepID=UPI001AAF3672|nr:phosphohydrolase [Nitratidesulfovibrio liaohensis]NHZ47587.1 phosphohydrolase [Nitratidesulfovibrio liaohensis]
MTATVGMPFTGDVESPREAAANRCMTVDDLPPLSFAAPNPADPTVPGSAWPVPDMAACHALWDRYAMPDHIRAHSLRVADMAMALARAALNNEAGGPNGPNSTDIHLPSVLASALLHDIAKDYTIRFGGNHAQLGGAWALHETGNPRIAQGVMHHVHWPWRVDVTVREWLMPLIIIYADKRVKHDQLVTLEERFDDLVERYGRTERIRERIRESHEQAVEIELALSARLGMALHDAVPRDGELTVNAG